MSGKKTLYILGSVALLIIAFIVAIFFANDPPPSGSAKEWAYWIFFGFAGIWTLIFFIAMYRIGSKMGPSKGKGKRKKSHDDDDDDDDDDDGGSDDGGSDGGDD